MEEFEFRRGRPDEIDWAIIDFVARRDPHGTTIPEIVKEVLPQGRYQFVRYRVETLGQSGLITVSRAFGRVLLFANETSEPLRGATGA